jgi:hypothetical protein
MNVPAPAPVTAEPPVEGPDADTPALRAHAGSGPVIPVADVTVPGEPRA